QSPTASPPTRIPTEEHLTPPSEVTSMRACGLALAALTLLPALAAAGPLPALIVEAADPGANAQVVADTVAGPIEQQVNGVDHSARLWSESTVGGNCRLTVTFRRDIGLALTQGLVRERVKRAAPALPALVRRRGVTVRPGTAGVLMIIPLVSPDGKRDVHSLS